MVRPCWRDSWKTCPLARSLSRTGLNLSGFRESRIKFRQAEAYPAVTMNLIDSHAHVDVSDFDADREAMLDRARAAGVGTLLAIGNGPEIEKLGAAVPYAGAHDWI